MPPWLSGDAQGLMEQSRGKECSGRNGQVHGWGKSRVIPMSMKKCDMS